MLITSTVMCLALAIHKEARGEPEQGKIAVGMVLINRAEINKVTPCQELHARASEWTWDKKSNTLSKAQKQKEWPSSEKAARDVLTLSEVNNLRYITHFHKIGIRKPRWTQKMKHVTNIGHHAFYSSQYK